MGVQMASMIGTTCRRCSECQGQDHHWMYVGDLDDTGEPVMSCKHCDATLAISDDEADALCAEDERRVEGR